MRDKFRRIVLVGLIAVVALLLVGCKTMRGGGWILSATGQGKATFGFQLQCKGGGEPDCAEVSGQLQYNDHSAGVRLHGVADGVFLCLDAARCEGAFAGPYRPQPKHLGEGGLFFVSMVDTGEPGASKGDLFCIELSGGIYDGYANCRNLEGGNIQAFE